MSTIDELGATLPPTQTVDVAEAFRAAEAVPVFLRSEVITQIIAAAVHYAAYTMSPALGTLAVMAHETGPDGLATPTGVHLRPYGCAFPTHELLLAQDGVPGAFLVAVTYDPPFTPEGKTRIRSLNAAVNADYEAAGKTFIDQILDSLNGRQSVDSPAAHALALAEANPATYAPIGAKTPVKSITITALDIDAKAQALWPWAIAGAHPMLESEDAEHASRALGIDQNRPSYQHGVIVVLKPHEEHDALLRRGMEHVGPRPDVPLAALSALLDAHGLMPRVHTANTTVAQTGWHTTNVGFFPILETAGHAAVCAQNGVFNRAVAERLDGYFWTRAAQTAEDTLGTWCSLVDALLAKGHTLPANWFSCNDGREQVYADRDGMIDTIHLKTQNGTYRVDITHNRDGQAQTVVAFQGTQQVARFVRGATGGLLPDTKDSALGPALTGTIRNVRDINGIFLGLDTAYCCLRQNA